METKQCSKCKTKKPLSEFHKNRVMADGYANQCKVCFNGTHKRYRQSAKYQETQADYVTTEGGKSVRAKANSKWKKTESGKASYASYYLHHKDRSRARGRVFDAVRSGRMQPASDFLCKCGQSAIEYHHYLGYSDEHSFDVIPLCKPCHITAEKN